MKKYLIPIVLVLAAASFAIAAAVLPPNEEMSTNDWLGTPECNIGVISIEGYLDSSPGDDVVDSLSIAQSISSIGSDSRNKALVIMLNTGGGSPSAAEEISAAIAHSTIPVISFIRGYATSGGYWIASQTSYIIAESTATIGSIGATSSYLDETKLNSLKGYTYEEIVSGRYKDVSNVNRPLDSDSRAYLQQYTDDVYKIFANTVQKNRALTDEQILKLSDAKVYLANNAKKLGLIDEIGDFISVKGYLASKLEIDPSQLGICDPIRFYPQPATSQPDQSSDADN